MAFEELAKCIKRDYRVETDFKHFMRVTHQLQEFLGTINIEYGESSSNAGDYAGAFDMAGLHESLDHLTS